jgi:hypothetical protein
MASRSETDSAAARPPSNAVLPVESVRLLLSSSGGRALLAFAGASLLFVANPTASHGLPGLWAPSAGLALVFVAWFGPRAGWLIVGAGLLAVLQTVLVGFLIVGRVDAASLGLTAVDALLATAEALAAWWVYRRLGGARSLNDPQSAVLFILVVPGLTAVLFAATRAFLDAAALGVWTDFASASLNGGSAGRWVCWRSRRRCWRRRRRGWCGVGWYGRKRRAGSNRRTTVTPAPTR